MEEDDPTDLLAPLTPDWVTVQLKVAEGEVGLVNVMAVDCPLQIVVLPVNETVGKGLIESETVAEAGGHPDAVIVYVYIPAGAEAGLMVPK